MSSSSDNGAVHQAAILASEPLAIHTRDHESPFFAPAGGWYMNGAGVAFLHLNGEGPKRRFIPWSAIVQVSQAVPPGQWPEALNAELEC